MTYVVRQDFLHSFTVSDLCDRRPARRARRSFRRGQLAVGFATLLFEMQAMRCPDTSPEQRTICSTDFWERESGILQEIGLSPIVQSAVASARSPEKLYRVVMLTCCESCHNKLNLHHLKKIFLYFSSTVCTNLPSRIRLGTEIVIDIK